MDGSALEYGCYLSVSCVANVLIGRDGSMESVSGVVICGFRHVMLPINRSGSCTVQQIGVCCLPL